MSKFQNFSHYQPDSSGYKLLPFRFTAVADEEYLLTNLAGEMTFLPRDRLAAFVNHKLHPDDPEYVDLRALHFLYRPEDRAALDLLALKVRTRFSRLADFTSLHMFVVSLRCEHTCQYCQVSRQSEDKASFDMTREIAEKGLDFVFRSPAPALKIEFQGGESLLNFELIQYIVEQAEARNKTQQRQLQFVIATNLAPVTPEMLYYCREHHILLSSSLDGPEDLHNKNRPRPGKNSHQKFLEGLHLAREIVGFDSVSALMTTTEASLPRVREIIDEYIRLGFQGIFLRPLSPYGFAIKTKSFAKYNATRWFEFYKEGLAYIIELNKAGIPFNEHYASLVLTKMLTSTDPGYVDLMNPSGAGIAGIIFNYDGSVYASDESRMLAEMGDKSFRLGSLLENTYEEIFLSDRLLNALDESFTLSAPMCSECAYEPYCGADPVYHHAMYKDVLGRKPESEFCQRNMAIFRYLADLMRSDKEVRQIFMRWANRC
ncbi:MAG: His-Xaa-Ser system radical SAM maturase HxsB [Porticoccaceae bacterium]